MYVLAVFAPCLAVWLAGQKKESEKVYQRVILNLLLTFPGIIYALCYALYSVMISFKVNLLLTFYLGFLRFGFLGIIHALYSVRMSFKEKDTTTKKREVVINGQLQEDGVEPSPQIGPIPDWLSNPSDKD